MDTTALFYSFQFASFETLPSVIRLSTILTARDGASCQFLLTLVLTREPQYFMVSYPSSPPHIELAPSC